MTTTATKTQPCLETATELIRACGTLNKKGCSFRDEREIIAFADQLGAAGVAFWHGVRLVATPVVGMGATQLGYSDRYPFEVIKVCTAKKVVLRAQHAEIDPTWTPNIIPGGFVGHCDNQDEQRWTITSSEDAPEVTVRLHADGRWYAADGQAFIIGRARRFHDYNF